MSAARIDRLASGEVFADKFEIRELIGRGGMGVVYRAWHRYLDKDVALKLVPLVARTTTVDLKERFRREAAAMGKLKHPHIVEVFDGGVQDDVAYIAMELMNGWNLRQLLVKGRLRHRQICGFLAQVADALACLHESKILHRDIKPENLFVTMDLRVKIIDFGLARVRTASKYATRNPIPAGTPQYMPPEQLLNNPIDESVDVYALGMVAWEAATGRHPIAAATGLVADRDAWVERMMSGEPLPDLGAQQCGAPVPFVDLVMQCLSFDPARRPTAAGVAQALRTISTDLEKMPASNVESEPMSIEERIQVLPPSTAKVGPAGGLGFDTPSTASTIERNVPSEDFMTPHVTSRAASAAAPTSGPHLELVASVPGTDPMPGAATKHDRPPTTRLPATPVMLDGSGGRRSVAPTIPAGDPRLSPGGLPAGRGVPSTLASNESYAERASREAGPPSTPLQGTPRRAHPKTVASASPPTPADGRPARTTEVLPPGFVPPGDPRPAHDSGEVTTPLHRGRGRGATVPYGSPVTTAPQGTPSTFASHAPSAGAVTPATALPSVGDGGMTPGPVAQSIDRSAQRRTRGIAFATGLVIAGGVAVALFVMRLHAETASGAEPRAGGTPTVNPGREAPRDDVAVGVTGRSESATPEPATPEQTSTAGAARRAERDPAPPVAAAATASASPVSSVTSTASTPAPTLTAAAPPIVRPAPSARPTSEVIDVWHD